MSELTKKQIAQLKRAAKTFDTDTRKHFVAGV